MIIKKSTDLYETAPCPMCMEQNIIVLYQRHNRIGVPPGEIVVTVGQCDNCGFVFNTPRPTRSFLRRYYRSSPYASGQTYHSVNDAGYYPQLNRERAEYFGQFVGTRSSGSYLDVGCGRGGFLGAMRENIPTGWTLQGLEPSEEACRVAQEKGFMVAQGYLGDNVLQPQMFDAISLISVFEHVPDPKTILAEIHRLLKPEGILFIEVPNTMHPEFSLSGYFGLEHICHFSPGMLANLYEIYGWTDYVNDPRIADHGLRLVGSSNLSAWGGEDFDQYSDDRNQLKEAVQLYAEKESAFLKMLQRRVESVLVRWKKAGKRIAVYGAGVHSIHLSAYIDLLSFADIFLDSDERKHGATFLDLPVFGPGDIEKQGVNAVLISSQRFQNEIEDELKRRYGATIEIATCYDDPENLFIC